MRCQRESATLDTRGGHGSETSQHIPLNVKSRWRQMQVLVRSYTPLQPCHGTLMFSGFNMFWTATPLMLAERFGSGEHGSGLFTLAGAGGALAAPITGRFAGRGHMRTATVGAMIMLGFG